MHEEHVDQVDDEDRVVGQVRRSDVYRLRANFRVVHVFLLNGRRQLLIHQLSAGKPRFGGAWGSSVAGAVRAGEAPEDAARREVREELGVEVADLRLVGRTAVREEGLTKFLYLYALVHDGPVHPDPGEIALAEFVDLPRLRDMMERRERAFTPTFQSALDLFEREASA